MAKAKEEPVVEQKEVSKPKVDRSNLIIILSAGIGGALIGLVLGGSLGGFVTAQEGFIDRPATIASAILCCPGTGLFVGALFAAILKFAKKNE